MASKKPEKTVTKPLPVRRSTAPLKEAIENCDFEYLTQNAHFCKRTNSLAGVVLQNITYPDGDNQLRSASVSKVSPLLFAVSLVTDNGGRHYKLLDELLQLYNPTSYMVELVKFSNGRQIWTTALHIAVVTNNVHAMDLLFRHNPELSYTHDHFGKAAIHVAAVCKHLVEDVMSLFIDRKATCDLNITTDGSNETAVRLAATTGNVPTLKLLIASAAVRRDQLGPFRKKGTSCSARSGKAKFGNVKCVCGMEIEDIDKIDPPVVHIASSADSYNVEVLKVLFNSCCDMNALDSTDNTIWIKAAEEGRDDVMEQLSKLGCDVNSRDVSGKTALHHAVEEGNTAKIMKLGELGCDVNCRDAEQMTPLHLAVKIHEDTEKLKALINIYGCNIDAHDGSQKTALHYAVELNRNDVIKELIGCSCDLNSRDNSGKTALHHAVIKGQMDTIQMLLSSKRCHRNIKDINGQTELNFAIICHAKNVDILRLLLDSGCNPRVRDKKNNTVFHYAMEQSVSSESLDLLWRYGGYTCTDDINAEQQSAVVYALTRGHTKNVPWLIHHGFDITSSDGDGKTPLHLAAEKDFVNVFVHLMKKLKRCDVTARDKKHRTVIHIAGNRVLLLLLGGSNETELCLYDTDGENRTRKSANVVCTVVAEAFNAPELYRLTQLVFETSNMLDSRHQSQYHRFVREIITSDARNMRSYELLDVAILLAPSNVCKSMINQESRQNTQMFKINKYENTTLTNAVSQNSYIKCRLLLENRLNIEVDEDAIEWAMSHNTDHKIVDLLVKHFKNQERLIKVLQRSCLVGESLWSLARRLKSERLQNFLTDRGIRHNAEEKSFHQTSRLMSRLKKHANSSWSLHKQIADSNRVVTEVHEYLLPNECNESQQIIDAVRAFLSRVSDGFKLYPGCEFLSFTPKLVGSMAEGTKAYLPNELDFVCELTGKSCMADEKRKYGHKTQIEATISDKGKGVLLRRTSELYKSKQSLGQSDLIDPRKLAKDFYDAIRKRIQELSTDTNKISNLVLHKKALQLRDKISCLHLLWNGTIFKNMMIYIDLVPAVRLSERFCPEKCLPLQRGRSLPYHAIAKKSRYDFSCNETNCVFPYSFALHETEFMRNISPNLREGYALAKAVRQAEICQIDSTSPYLYTEEPLYIVDEITTYMLKTCLFRIHEKYFVNDSNKNFNAITKETATVNIATPLSNDERSKFDWAIRIYEELKLCFAKGKLETFYGDNVLFQCSHTDDVSSDRICCLKRRFITCMCDAIIQWLHEHRAELQELEDVYDDCRLEVYNRDQTESAVCGQPAVLS